MENYRNLGSASESTRLLIVFSFLCLPGFLDNVLYRYLATPEAIYGADYVIRICVLVPFVVMPSLRTRAVDALRLPSHPLIAAVLGFLVWVFIVIEYPDVSAKGQFWSGFWQYSGYPPLHAGWLKTFDLTVGLTLVAFSEELIFRMLAYDVLSLVTNRFWLIVVASSVLFGLIHWGNGLGGILAGFVAGIPFMWLYRKTGSLLPVIVVHYFVDFILSG